MDASEVTVHPCQIAADAAAAAAAVVVDDLTSGDNQISFGVFLGQMGNQRSRRFLM